MMRNNKGFAMSSNVRLPSLFLTIALYSFCAAAEMSANGWNITSDAFGGVTMTLANPATPLKIESSIVIIVDNQGTPLRGTVKFTSGAERELNAPEELQLFWNAFKGVNAAWEYYASTNRVDLFNPDETSIPAPMYGRFSRIITKEGREYYGKLIAFEINPDWFRIQIGGATVNAYRHAIKVIQQLKG
jgi:hypothetical protein